VAQLQPEQGQAEDQGGNQGHLQKDQEQQVQAIRMGGA
jgi:hypothetical protein